VAGVGGRQVADQVLPVRVSNQLGVHVTRGSEQKKNVVLAVRVIKEIFAILFKMQKKNKSNL
jgi:hypothetical protein